MRSRVQVRGQVISEEFHTSQLVTGSENKSLKLLGLLSLRLRLTRLEQRQKKKKNRNSVVGQSNI